MCFLKVFGLRPFNPINKHYNPYLPCISQDTMYMYLFSLPVLNIFHNFQLPLVISKLLSGPRGPEGKNDTDVPKSALEALPKYCVGCELPESALSLSFPCTRGLWSVHPRPLIQSETCPQFQPSVVFFQSSV